MRRGASLFILVMALVMGGIAAFLAKNWIQSHSSETVAEQPGTIVIANAALAFGAAITPDNVREIPWPANAMPQGAFTSVNALLKDGRRLVLSREPVPGR